MTARAGGITLDTLFIDEGFGALDAETLDVAMRTLDELRQGGRTVGVISHVEAMKEQLPAQLLVEVTPEGWSAVRQEALAPAGTEAIVVDPHRPGVVCGQRCARGNAGRAPFGSPHRSGTSPHAMSQRCDRTLP